MANSSFSKFIRPAEGSRGPITARDLDLIEAILRYRFCPTSQLVRLVGGNEDVTQRRLRRLWEKGLINRWAFPGIRTHSEFHYYLDSRESLDLLAHHRRLAEIHPQMLDELKAHREKDYASAAVRGQHMQLGFLQHSLMISRFHFMLDMGSRASGGSVELQGFTQGGQLSGHKIEVPKIVSSRQGNQEFWRETDQSQRLPVEPDALVTLRFRDRPQAQQLAHFFYEADRGTMVMTDMLRKLRAYYHFIKSHQHRTAFGVHPIRAVLIETSDEERGKKLMALANHPLVSGKGRRAGLFWFTISALFNDPKKVGAQPDYLQRPELVLKPIWALPDHSLHSLSDAENFPLPIGTA